jgi:hypothetical protein
LEGEGLTYTWTQTDGPAVTLSDVNAAQPTFAAPDVDQPTTLGFRLDISDGENNHTDTVEITVNPVEQTSGDRNDPSPTDESPIVPPPEVPDSRPERSDDPDTKEARSPDTIHDLADEVALPDATGTEDDAPRIDAGTDRGAKDDRGGQAEGEMDSGGTDDGAIPTTSTEAEDSAPQGWDGAEQLDMLDPLDDLSGSVEFLRAPEEAFRDLAAEANLTPEVTSVEAEYHPVRVIELTPASRADAPAADIISSAPNGSLADAFEEVPRESNAPSNDQTQEWAAEQSDEQGPRRQLRGAAEEVLANSPGSTAAGHSETHMDGSADVSGVPFSEPQGFFARLWGAVRGFVGTARIGDRSEGDAERTQRRP